jgi:hypothetical protein
VAPGFEVLALALLVTWVLADNHDATVATDDLALVANLLDAWVYLHVSYFFIGVLANRFTTGNWRYPSSLGCLGLGRRLICSGK